MRFGTLGIVAAAAVVAWTGPAQATLERPFPTQVAQVDGLSGWKGGKIRRGPDGKIIRDTEAVDPLAAVTQGRKKVGIGSSFFITDQGHVLTNNHVIEKCDLITLETPAGQGAAATLLGVWKEADLALLKTDLKPVGTAKFQAGAPLSEGTSLAMVGYPTVKLPPLNPKYIAGVYGKRLGEKHPFYTLTGEVFPGNSGGPVVDAAGNIVGVVVAKVNTPKLFEKTGKLVEDLSYAIRLDVTRHFVKKHKVKVTVADATSPTLDREARFARAKQFVARVGCWK